MFDSHLFLICSIARYLAKVRRDTELTGKSFFESSLVDAWVDFASHEVELPSSILTYPILGFTEHNKQSESFVSGWWTAAV